MPIYVYQSVDVNQGCEHCKNSFEVLQSCSDALLTVCPECKKPVKRVIQASAVIMGKSHLLTDQNLKKHGFSKLVNEGGGQFRKI